MEKTYRRICDPGHSWLEVPVEDVRDLAGVFDEITNFSPLKKRKFYLEEDCDLDTFFMAMRNKGYKVNMINTIVSDFESFMNSL
jgi:hypothetical protein